MGSALLNPLPQDTDQPLAASANALRLQVAERLAAHRDRRDRQRPRPASPSMPTAPPSGSRAARIAATVANRYAQSQSYRAFLAAEAERAVQQAHAAAEIAARNAEAALQAQRQLLEDLAHAALEQARLEEEARREELQLQPAPALWPDLKTETGGTSVGDCTQRVGHRADVRPPSQPKTGLKTDSKTAPATERAIPDPGPKQKSPVLTVHLFGGGGYPETATSHGLQRSHYATGATQPGQYRYHGFNPEDALEARALDEEIAFRHAPVFEEPAGPPTALPTNLIEFPRQLIAPRKARPRHAEGPLREEKPAESGDAQLRIFEVDPAHISITPGLVDSESAQWTSLWLDTVASQYTASGAALDVEAGDVAARLVAIPRPQPAAFARRLRAAAIDAVVVLTGLVASVATAAAVATGTAQLAVAGRAIASQPALSAATGAVAVAWLYLLYQALFFTLSEATPGMRLTRIALCTLSDENPTRRAMQRRILTVVVAALPAGLGLAWALLDEDRLPWHDRLSRMYPRSY